MNLLNAILGLSFLAISSFGLYKTIESASCRHQQVSRGFWMASGMLTSPKTETQEDEACGSSLTVTLTQKGLRARQAHGDYHFQISTDLHSRELE